MSPDPGTTDVLPPRRRKLGWPRGYAAVPALAASLANCTMFATVGENFGETSDTNVSGDPDPQLSESTASETASASGTVSPTETATQTSASSTPDTPSELSSTESTTESTTESSTEGATQTQTSLCNPPEPSECLDDQGAGQLGIGCLLTSSTPNSGFQYTGYQGAALTLVGSAGGFVPRNGDELIILSTGRADNILTHPEVLLDEGSCDPPAVESEFEQVLACPSENLPSEDYDVAARDRPFNAVDNATDNTRDCFDDPWRLGAGDCSNSLKRLVAGRQCPPSPGVGVPVCSEWLIKDSALLRVTVEVPAEVSSLNFDFAFLTAEYPYNTHKSPARYLDAFIVWVESKKWTGNVVFSPSGAPITGESEFVTLTPNTLGDNPLRDTAFVDHAGTPWLTTYFEVVPGETVNLYFEIMDLGYNVLDSAVILDNLRWGCDTGRPRTSVL